MLALISAIFTYQTLCSSRQPYEIIFVSISLNEKVQHREVQSSIRPHVQELVHTRFKPWQF